MDPIYNFIIFYIIYLEYDNESTWDDTNGSAIILRPCTIHRKRDIRSFVDYHVTDYISLEFDSLLILEIFLKRCNSSLSLQIRIQ